MELENIPKIGNKTLNDLHKLNIFTTNDLINFYPYRYNFYNPTNINNTQDNITITINGIIESTPKIVFIKRNLNYLSFFIVSLPTIPSTSSFLAF